MSRPGTHHCIKHDEVYVGECPRCAEIKKAFDDGVRKGWKDADTIEDETAAMGFIFGGLKEEDLSERQMKIVAKIKSGVAAKNGARGGAKSRRKLSKKEAARIAKVRWSKPIQPNRYARTRIKCRLFLATMPLPSRSQK